MKINVLIENLNTPKKLFMPNNLWFWTTQIYVSISSSSWMRFRSLMLRYLTCTEQNHFSQTCWLYFHKCSLVFVWLEGCTDGSGSAHPPKPHFSFKATSCATGSQPLLWYENILSQTQDLGFSSVELSPHFPNLSSSLWIAVLPATISTSSTNPTNFLTSTNLERVHSLPPFHH